MRIIINIVTAAITTSIGILAGRKIERREFNAERISNRIYNRNILKMMDSEVHRWWIRSNRFMEEYYIAEMKVLSLKKKLKEVKEKVEKQEEWKAEQAIKDKQLKIINHYGLEKQLDQLLEESGELVVAIAKNKRYSRPGSSLGHYENLVEELADVKNLIEQIELQNPYIKEGIEVMTKHKTDREIERIGVIEGE